MALYIIVPAGRKTALESAKYAPAAKSERESKLPAKARELWALQPMPLKDGRLAIPADVVDHPAYASRANELKGYPVEDLKDDALDLPVDTVIP